MTPVSLSLVIPVYNERARIAATIERLAARFAPAHQVELIVVDDGSTDGTAEAVREQARRHPQVRLLPGDRHAGKGAAVRRGLLEAAGDVRCFCDADLAIPPEDIARVVGAVERGADVAIASRAVAGSRVVPPPGLARRLISRLFNQVVRRGLGLPFGDTQCGCKAFRGGVVGPLFEPLRTPGFVFDVEVLLGAVRRGYTVAEVPVRVENRRSSTVNFITQAGPVCRDLLRLVRQARNTPAPAARTPC